MIPAPLLHFVREASVVAFRLYQRLQQTNSLSVAAGEVTAENEGDGCSGGSCGGGDQRHWRQSRTHGYTPCAQLEWLGWLERKVDPRNKLLALMFASLVNFIKE